MKAADAGTANFSGGGSAFDGANAFVAGHHPPERVSSGDARDLGLAEAVEGPATDKPIGKRGDARFVADEERVVERCEVMRQAAMSRARWRQRFVNRDEEVGCEHRRDELGGLHRTNERAGDDGARNDPLAGERLAEASRIGSTARGEETALVLKVEPVDRLRVANQIKRHSRSLPIAPWRLATVNETEHAIDGTRASVVLRAARPTLVAGEEPSTGRTAVVGRSKVAEGVYAQVVRDEESVGSLRRRVEIADLDARRPQGTHSEPEKKPVLVEA